MGTLENKALSFGLEQSGPGSGPHLGIFGVIRVQPTFLEAVLVLLGPYIGVTWGSRRTPTTRSQRCTSVPKNAEVATGHHY